MTDQTTRDDASTKVFIVEFTVENLTHEIVALAVTKRGASTATLMDDAALTGVLGDVAIRRAGGGRRGTLAS